MLRLFACFFFLDPFRLQVLPSEFGVRKAPCFCVTALFRRKRRVVTADSDDDALGSTVVFVWFSSPNAVV